MEKSVCLGPAAFDILIHSFNPLTQGALCPKLIFWTFWKFSAWKLAILATIYSKGICNMRACHISTSTMFYSMNAS